MAASPATRHADTKRPQYQTHDAHDALTQHETTRDHYQANIFPAALSHFLVIYELDDATDETRKREGRRVQKTDCEGDSGRDPLRVPELTTRCMSLEGGDGAEDDCERKHEQATVGRQLAVA